MTPKQPPDAVAVISEGQEGGKAGHKTIHNRRVSAAGSFWATYRWPRGNGLQGQKRFFSRSERKNGKRHVEPGFSPCVSMPTNATFTQRATKVAKMVSG